MLAGGRKAGFRCTEISVFHTKLLFESRHGYKGDKYSLCILMINENRPKFLEYNKPSGHHINIG